MSGSNQHFIPQLLQRGFVSRRTATRSYVYCYSKNDEVRERTTRSLGAEQHFYSAPTNDGSPTLDDKITAYENGLAIKLNALREAISGHPVESALAAEIVTHLSARTRSMRSTFWKGITGLVDSLRDRLIDDDSVASFFRINDNSVDSVLVAAIRNAVNEQPEWGQFAAMINVDKSVISKVMITLLREHFNSYSELLLQFSQRQLIPALSAATDTVPDGHNKALHRLMDEGVKRTDFLDMKWSIEEQPGYEFILPDCVSVSVGSEGNYAPFIVRKDMECDFILLPISHNRMLVGRRTLGKELDLARFNEQAASCCAEFFIARSLREDLIPLSMKIGSQAEEFLRSVAIEVIDDMLGGPISEGVETPLETERLEQYDVLFFDCGDADEAQRFANQIQPLIFKLSEFLDLGRLDGITVAYDYPRALVELDRGDARLPPASTVPESAGIGMAQSVLILRKNRIQFRIVIRYDIALALLSDDETAQSTALHLITDQLAQTDVITTIDRAFPDVLLKPLDEYHASMLFREAYPAITGYFAARTSLDFGVDDFFEDQHTTHFSSAIQRYASEIPDVMADYQEHQNVDRLFAEVLEPVGQMMHSLSRHIGHQDRAGRNFLDNTEVKVALDSQCLTEWAQRYAFELRQLWKSFGRWKSFDEFIDINVHVERLMWRHGLFSWPEGGGAHITVMPPAFDFNGMIRNLPDELVRAVAPHAVGLFDQLRSVATHVAD